MHCCLHNSELNSREREGVCGSFSWPLPISTLYKEGERAFRPAVVATDQLTNMTNFPFGNRDQFSTPYKGLSGFGCNQFLLRKETERPMHTSLYSLFTPSWPQPKSSSTGVRMCSSQHILRQLLWDMSEIPSVCTFRVANVCALPIIAIYTVCNLRNSMYHKDGQCSQTIVYCYIVHQSPAPYHACLSSLTEPAVTTRDTILAPWGSSPTPPTASLEI